MNLSGNLNKTIFFSATLIVGGLLFIAIIENVGVANIIETIMKFELRHFVVLLLLNFIAIIISALRWNIILNVSQNKIPFSKVLAARLIGNSINYLTPSGLVLGEPFKAMVLSGKTELSLGATMASVIIEGSIFLGALFAFITIGIFIFLTYSDVSSKLVAVIAGVLSFLFAIFYLFFTKMVKTSSKKGEKGFFSYLIDILHLHKFSFINKLRDRIMRREHEIKNFFLLHKKTVVVLILLSILEIIITLISCWFVLYFLGVKTNLKAILGLYSLMNISYLIPLPGSLGGLELSQIFAFNFFNLGGQTIALAFALITRLSSLVIVALGIIYLIHFEIALITKKSVELARFLHQKIKGIIQSL